MKKVNLFRGLVLVALLILASCQSQSKKLKDLKDGIYAEIITNKGEMLVELHYEEMPLTVGNFVALAEGENSKVDSSRIGKPFYNGLKFHRVLPDFMAQTGDPLGTGAGGPGYKFADEFPKNEKGELLFKHTGKGVLSMANSGKNTNGSQFFITHKATTWLDGKHSVFGIVVEKYMDNIDAIVQGDTIKEINILRKGRKAKKFDANKTFLAEIDLVDSKKEEEINKNKELAVKFIASKKTEETIKLASGLEYIVHKKGSGVNVAVNDKVKVHYTGYLTNGTKFDSSLDRGEPFEFTVGVDRLISGWTEGVKLLNKGSKVTLFIPAKLGWGARGSGGLIPPNSDVIFEMEVLEIMK
ncbi:MAG: peptidylprolyl isomerase [Flavobacteriaceae bacterium]|nr:peptidylprolyl isomerase [Flavobacteriaceae bacterium]